jgi:hypothetical protein
MRPLLPVVVLCSVSCAALIFQGCNRGPLTTVDASAPPPSATAPPPAPPPPPEPPQVVTAGTSVRVRLDEAIDTRRNRPGDRFTATLDEPLVSGDRVIVPKGVTFTGRVTQAKPSGRFKGHAILALKLESFDLNGHTYPIESVHSQMSRGHKKHNWLWIGGTSAGGAAIGAAAGGPAALIGAGAGAAAGTVGAAITGKRQIDLPAETRVTFTLRTDVQLDG